MSAVEELDDSSITPGRRVLIAIPAPARRSRRPSTSRPARRSAFRLVRPDHEAEMASPTTSIGNVLLTLIISFGLATLLGARGIIHAGAGMPDGPLRTGTIELGQRALQLADSVQLVRPWDDFQAALGRNTQPSVPPLLATIPTVLPFHPRQSAPSPSLHHPGVTHGTKQTGWDRRTMALAFVSRRIRRVQSPPAAPLLRRPTRENPLRLLVTGDSLTGYLGPELVNEAASSGPVRGFVDTHNGTGLTRPDYVDWSVVARQQVASDHPDAVVILIGGNDFQNMTLPNGKVLTAGTWAWTQEYQRRVEVCMRIWLQGQGRSRRIYWLSIPPARDPSWAYDDNQINLAISRAAARIRGARYVDILGPVTNHGRYADFVSDGHGQLTLVREPDGVHLNLAGSTIVAHEIMPLLAHDWHLR